MEARRLLARIDPAGSEVSYGKYPVRNGPYRSRSQRSTLSTSYARPVYALDAMRLTATDVERILNDIVTRRGTPVTLVHIERRRMRWYLTVRDHANHELAFDLRDTTKHTFRAALAYWADQHLQRFAGTHERR